MAKPTYIRVPSDDCEVPVGDQVFNVHEGEWVDVLPIRLVGDNRFFVTVNRLQVELEAVKGDEDESQRVSEIMARHFDRVVGFIRPRIGAWSWTDMDGKPLPQPAEDPDVFERISSDELLYLTRVVQTGRPAAAVEAEAKNA
jgi:hypothetical protein